MAEEMARYGCAEPEILDELRNAEGKLPSRPPLPWLVKRQAVLAIDVLQETVETYNGILLR